MSAAPFTPGSLEGAPQAPRPFYPPAPPPPVRPPPMPGPLLPWSGADERRLKKAREEVEAMEARRNAAGDALEAALLNAGIADGTQELAEILAHHAGDIRDALEPFDTGVRQANG